MAQSPSRPIVAVRRRVAWIFEDELMRRNAERWLSLFGDRLFRAEIRPSARSDPLCRGWRWMRQISRACTQTTRG